MKFDKYILKIYVYFMYNFFNNFYLTTFLCSYNSNMNKKIRPLNNRVPEKFYIQITYSNVLDKTNKSPLYITHFSNRK